MRSDPRSSLIRLLENDTAKLVAVVGATFLLGVGVAGAAISATPPDAINPAARALTSTSGLELRRAFGPEDEDCFIATKRVMESGQWVKRQRLVCPDG